MYVGRQIMLESRLRLLSVMTGPPSSISPTIGKTVDASASLYSDIVTLTAIFASFDAGP
jgi:hypothetical protein